ncbi:MAG: gliding motility-associated C-terminal domain-containing protein [Sediminibacterium sp.]|nr:gliding motility-associated C-terminal domain-containing protein [Sediminibacterium sp.]
MDVVQGSTSCIRALCLLVLLFLSGAGLMAQCGTGTSEIIVVDFSAAKDTSHSIDAERNGTACVGTSGSDKSCIRFNVILNPGSDLLNFSTNQITGASFYSIDCGPLIAIGTPACITGKTSVCISFCKPGSNSVTYTLTASSTIKASADLILRQNCSGTMSVTGVTAATVNWTSVYPSAAGTYNSYLSAVTGATNITVTPQTGAPEYIDYEVSGTGTCTGLRRDTIRVYTVAPMTVSVTPANPTICSGSSVQLTTTVTGGNAPYTYSWNSGETSTSITASVAGIYTVSVNDNTVGCPAVTASALVASSITPDAPTAVGTAVCYGSTATLTATAPGGTYQWFDAASAGNLLTATSAYTTPALSATTTYYVQTTVNGCTSARTAVPVSVTAVPVAPTVAPVTVCEATTATLTATAPGGSYEWFNTASGGTSVGTGSGYISPVLSASTIYYVQTTVSGCTSPRTGVTVTVTPLPANPMANAPAICSGNTGTLTALTPGGTYRWYDAATAGTLLGTGAAFNTPVLLTDATYYLSAEVNGCVSPARTAVSITVNPTPAAPTAAGTTICSGTTASLTATDMGETYRWYTASTGGTLLSTGLGYTTPALAASTTYYVDATSAAGCTGTRTAVLVNVTPFEDPAFTYSGGTFCVSGGSNPTPSIMGAATGVFSATPAGLDINPTSGEISLSTSTVNLYTITFVTGGACNYTSSADVRIINTTPVATFSYVTPMCEMQTNPLPVFAADASAGVFTSGTGLVFNNATTGEIDLTSSAPGTYTIKNEIPAAAGCSGAMATFDIVINPRAIANAGVDQLVCAGTTVDLTGVVSGSASSGSWSLVSGGGSITNQSQLNTQYAPAGGVTQAILQLTTNDPDVAGPCAVATDQVIVSFNPLPASPQVNSPAICSNTNATLTAYAPGGTYKWYDAPAATSAVYTGTTYQTPTLLANTVYYVSATSAASCEGPRTSVTVVVNQRPVVTSASTGAICTATSTDYTITSDIAGSSFLWQRAAVSGISNNVVSGQTTAYIGETLNSILSVPVDVLYNITPSSNGCAGTPFQYRVTVNPIPVAPTAATLGAVCAGQTLTLTTPERTEAAYEWTGPNGFTSLLREPQLLNATLTQAGTYAVTLRVNGCTSVAATTVAVVNPIPSAPLITSTAPVCEGASLQLNASIVVGATYQWTGPNGFGSALQNPMVPNMSQAAGGTYSVSALVNGCSSALRTVVVSVKTIPAAPVIQPVGAICENATLHVGVDAVPGAIYSWSGPLGFSASGQEFQISGITLAMAGTYTATATVNGCTSNNSSVNIPVTPQPALPVAANNSPVCEGASLQLSTPSLAGASYQWTGPNGFTSVAQNPMLTSITQAGKGDYTLAITVNGCTSNGSVTTAVVNSLPGAVQITSSGPACEGQPVSLAADEVPSAVYFWTGPGGLVTSTRLINIPAMSNQYQGIYQVAVNVAGCTGSTSNIELKMIPTPAAPVISPVGIVCEYSTLNVNLATVAGAVYSWTGPSGFSQSSAAVQIDSVTAVHAGMYTANISVSGCKSSNSTVTVAVTPKPSIPVVGNSSPICDGGTLQFNASALTGASYQWTGPNGFTAAVQNPLINGAGVTADGDYVLTVSVNGCASDPAVTKAIVNAVPAVVNITSNGPVCDGQTLRLSADDVKAAVYTWIGPNGFSAAAREIDIPAFNSSKTGEYQVAVAVAGCSGVANSITTSVKPIPAPPVINPVDLVCDGGRLTLSVVTAPGASYQWSGPMNIRGTQPLLTIPVIHPSMAGTYYANVTINGCTSGDRATLVDVLPKPDRPVVVNSDPVCVNDVFQLRASTVTGATYQWRGPGNYFADIPDPVIPSAGLQDTGKYEVTVTVNGCASDTAYTFLHVDIPASTSAGNDQVVCANNPVVYLSGIVQGGTTTGVWSSSGTGRFSSSTTNLSGAYIPSTSDTAAGTVTLFLTSTNNGACRPAVSTVRVTITDAPVANAGSDARVCANDSTVLLNGIVRNVSQVVWSSTGTGSFVPSATDLRATYVPSSADIASGNFQLQLTTTDNGKCLAVSDALSVSIAPVPVVDAGKDRYVFAKMPFTLSPVVSSDVQLYKWSPAQYLSDPNSKNPVFSGEEDQLLTLQVTNGERCMSVDQIKLVVLKPIRIPNVFSPNGDGIHDSWIIAELSKYPAADVSVFDRYGKLVFQAKDGYVKPWNGTYNGKPLPVATYYYIIEPKFEEYVQKLFSGSVTILR